MHSVQNSFPVYPCFQNLPALAMAFLLAVGMVCPPAWAQLPAPTLPPIEDHFLPSDDNFVPHEDNFGSRQADRLTTSSGGKAFLLVTENLLNKFIQTTTVDEGPVRDFVMGAEVLGTQRTNAQTSLSFTPCETAARILIHLNGTTTNQTTSYTPQAAIQSCGTYEFELAKQVQFDGEMLSTWSPSAFVTIDQANTAAMTRLTPVPVIGPIANRTALNIANRQQPLAEQIAARKITEQVAPIFNQSIDQQIASINQSVLAGARDWLNGTQLNLQWTPRTTEQQLILEVSSGTSSRAATQTPTTELAAEADGAFLMEEGLVKALLDKLPLKGMRITDTQLNALVENQRFELPAPAPPQLVTLVLDPSNPLQIWLREGSIEVEVRLSIQPVLGQPIPTHLLAMRFTPQLRSDSLVFVPEVLEFRPVESGAGLSSVFTKDVIQSQLENELESQPLPRSFTFPAVSGEGMQTFTFQTIEIRRGELKVDFQVSDRSEQAQPLRLTHQ